MIMAVRISFDSESLEANVSKILGRKFKIDDYDGIDTEIAGSYAMHIARYVPYKTGRLLHSARVGDGKITYSAKVKRKSGIYDYAGIQYLVPFPQESRSTPGTYDHWNRHLTTAERKAFYDDVAKLVIERMNNG